jgi:hypothetical protein
MPRSVTSSAPTSAVPTADARFCVVPRIDPTSPASRRGAEVTSTLNTRVTSAPWPTPNTTSPRIVGSVSQLFVTTSDNQTSATVVSANPARPIVRGGNRPYSRTTSVATTNTVRLNGIIASAVSSGVRPCTIWT